MKKKISKIIGIAVLTSVIFTTGIVVGNSITANKFESPKKTTYKNYKDSNKDEVEDTIESYNEENQEENTETVYVDSEPEESIEYNIGNNTFKVKFMKNITLVDNESERKWASIPVTVTNISKQDQSIEHVSRFSKMMENDISIQNQNGSISEMSLNSTLNRPLRPGESYDNTLNTSFSSKISSLTVKSKGDNRTFKFNITN